MDLQWTFKGPMLSGYQGFPRQPRVWANYKDYTKVETSSGSFQLSWKATDTSSCAIAGMILEKLLGASGGVFGWFWNALRQFLCVSGPSLFSPCFLFVKPLIPLYCPIIICPDIGQLRKRNGTTLREETGQNVEMHVELKSPVNINQLYLYRYETNYLFISRTLPS